MTRIVCVCAVVANIAALVAPLSGGHSVGGHRLAGLPVIRFRTKTGVTVLLHQESASRTVALAVAVRSGRAEADAPPGIGALVSTALFGSNSNLSREAVARALYFAGGDVRTSWMPECVTVSLVTSPEGFSRAVYILAQGMKNADLDQETVAHAIQEQQHELARDAGDPVTIGAQAARAYLYANHPYGRPVRGTAEELKKITRSQLRSYYETAFQPANTVVAVCGNLDAAYVRRVMENNFVDYEQRPSPARREPMTPDLTEPPIPRRLTVRTAAETAAVLVAYRTCGRGDPAYPATKVLATILGGGKASRLFQTVRDRKGVGYRVGAEVHAFAHGGVIYAYAEVSAQRADDVFLEEVEAMVVEATESVLRKPPSEQELHRARHLAGGLHRQSRQRATDLALALAEAEALTGSFESDTALPNRLATVTAEDVVGEARRVLTNRCVVIVRPDRARKGP